MSKLDSNLAHLSYPWLNLQFLNYTTCAKFLYIEAIYKNKIVVFCQRLYVYYKMIFAFFA